MAGRGLQPAPILTADDTLEHFHAHGWLRVRQAFSPDEAARMQDVLWAGLAEAGIRRDDASTWTVERPGKLQSLKAHPAFAAVGSQRLLEMVDAILETRAYEKPNHWGALFVAFPSQDPFCVPSGGWHVDANYRSQLSPPKGVQIHALFGDVLPRSGATQVLSGSHRLIHRWFQENPAPADARSLDMRKRLLGHPYLRDLHTEGDTGARIARFMDRVEEVDGIPLQVIENTGAAPRLLLSGGITTDLAGWG